MNILNLLAQSSYSYDRDFESSARAAELSAAGIATLMVFIVVSLIFTLVVYAFFAYCMMRIFKKAGVPTWIAWVPFYNTWKMLEIGGQPGFWAVLSIIPVVNIVSAVFLYIAFFHIGKKLGKGSEFVLWGIFLPYVWYAWLAFDKSTWNDAASTAPSLHRG